jgi:hypothetical protein
MLKFEKKIRIKLELKKFVFFISITLNLFIFNSIISNAGYDF